MGETPVALESRPARLNTETLIMLFTDRALLLSLIVTFGVAKAPAQTPPATKTDEGKFDVTVTVVTGKKAQRRIKEAGRSAGAGAKFTEKDNECHGLLKVRKLDEAEIVCKAAARLSDQ